MVHGVIYFDGKIELLVENYRDSQRVEARKVFSELMKERQIQYEGYHENKNESGDHEAESF